MTKLLFLLKKNSEYGTYIGQRSGLYNSAKILADRISDKYDIETKLEICIDGNSIDKELTLYKPDYCIIEAIWVTPDKLRELNKLHPNVIFIIRIHSEIPFLANEGIALGWIKEFFNVPNVLVAPNARDTFDEMIETMVPNEDDRHYIEYLPNVYRKTGKSKDFDFIEFSKELISYKVLGETKQQFRGTLDVGCFGALRPMKNQLIQAIAAMRYANNAGAKLRFHINGSRTELGGEAILKNLRNLFTGTKHKLIEHPWLDTKDFLKLVRSMDFGMQVSFSESFNIVTADFVSQRVPIIVSDAIKWMPEALTVSTVKSDDIVHKIGQVLRYRTMFSTLQTLALMSYNRSALSEWKFLENKYRGVEN